MKTKQEIIKESGIEYTDLISSSTMGAIENAMEQYLNEYRKGLVVLISAGPTLHNGECKCTALSSLTIRDNKCHCLDCGGIVNGIGG